MMLYTDVVNATLLSADPTVPETIRRQAVVFLDEFLNSPESFKISVDIFGRGRDEFSSITRMFCLTVIEHCIEQRFNTLDPSECDSFRDKMWIWYTDSIRDELFIRNKLIKVLVVLFGKRYYNNSQEFFNHLIAVLRMQSATPEDYYSKVEMFLKACKTLNEEIIAPSSLDPNREFQERSNEIKDSVREGVLVALTSEWISIMNDCYQRGIHKLVKLCLDTFSEYIPWMPIEFSTSSEFVQSMYQYAEIEDLSASAVDCITQIVLKKMPPIDKLILIQSLDMTLILDKLVQMSSALDSDMKTAHLINVLGTAFCDGCKSEKSTSQEKEECMKRLEWLNVYARKIVLDNAEDEVVSALYPYLHSYLTIIGEIRRRFSTAAQADVYLSQVASILHTVILAMKYSEHYPYSESDAHEEDFPFTKKRAVSDYLYFVRLAFNVFQTLKKLFNTIGGIVPDLQISYVFQLVEQTLKPPTMLELPWADIELALLLISLVRDTVKKSGKTPQRDECVIISYLQVIYKHYQYFEVHENRIPEVLEYILSRRDAASLFQSTRVRSQYVLRHLIKNLRSQLSSYVEEIMPAFKACLSDVLNTPPTEDEQKELKLSDRNHSPSSVSMFEAIGTLILISDILDSKKSNLLKEIIDPIVDRIAGIMRTNFYLNGESPEYILYICKLSHIIIAIGNVSKDFTTRDITSKKVREPNLPDPYIEVFARAIDTIVEVVKVLSDNYHIRTAIIFTFRRMVDCAGEHIMKCIFLLIKEGILRSMTMPEVADILHLFVQLIAKLQISGADIVEMLCYILDVLHSLSFQSDEGGTDHHNDMTLLRRNYISLMLHILQLKSAYELLIFLDKAGYFSAITNSLVNFCYESDYLAQRSALSSVVKLVGVWGKGELGDCYGDYSTDMWKVDPAECSSPLQDGAFMDDFKTEANGGKNAPLPGFTPFLLEKVVPMLFGVLETSNLKAGDSRTRCIIAEVTKAHFEILRFQGYKYPYYLGKVFFRSMPVPSPYANNFLTVLSSNDQKACNNLLTSYATHLSANPK